MQLKTIRALSGETVKVTNQWAAEIEQRGTTVSSSEWDFCDDSAIASPALSGSVTTCLLTPTGCGTLKNTVTLANGEVLIAQRRVEV